MQKLFWQYPVITEKTFYLQNQSNSCYIGIPWATIIDSKFDLNVLYTMIVKSINTNQDNITCCQHIFFRKLIPLFKLLGIKTLYTPHKVVGEDNIDGIIIKPCPLFAVNVEDSERNAIFQNVDFINVHRKYLYSFQGAYQKDYLSSIRQNIFDLPSNNKDDVFIQNIGGWHFNEIVYSDNQNDKQVMETTVEHLQNKNAYNQLLLDSKFSLCPSGTGPNSIRFWEALAVGSIPVLLSDTLELPSHKLWDKSIIRIPEKHIFKIDEILRSISDEEQSIRRKNCISIYEYFKNNFKNVGNES